MYSIDFRKQVLHSYSQHKSSRKVASFYRIHHSTLCRWVKRIFPVKRVSRLSHRKRFLDETIKEFIDKSPISSQLEILSFVRSVFPHSSFSRRSIRHSLSRLKYSRKRVKKKHRIQSHPQKDRIEEIFNVFTQSSHPILCIDESGFADRFARRYGYSRVGTECVLPPNSPTSFRASLVLAISNRGEMFHRIFTSSVKASDFLSFLQSVDSPKGTILVMDNCSIHKSKVIREFIRSKNWIGIYLPSYCPDLNPVELCFGHLKYLYRKSLRKNNISVIEEILLSITPSMIQKSYQHVTKLLAENVE